MIQKTILILTAFAMLSMNSQAQNYRDKIQKLKNVKGSTKTKVKSTPQTEGKTSNQKEEMSSDKSDNTVEALNTKYEEIKSKLYEVDKYLKTASFDNYDEFLKALTILDADKYSILSIETMLNDPAEQAKVDLAGGIRYRTQIKDAILPGIKSALERKEGEYSLKRLEDKLSEIGGIISTAKGNGPDSDDKAQEIQDFYTGILLFQKFCNNHMVLEGMVKKAKYYNTSVQTSNSAKYAKYRSGDFHKKHGSGIYVVQKDGVTAKTLTEELVTNTVLIDGKKPVHIFVLTDMGLSSYGSFLQFDLVDEGKSTNQNKYVYDAKRMIPVSKNEMELGAKKLVFVPSATWGDIEKTYSKSMFYSGSIQRRLAEVLVPGVPQKFTIYSANSKLKTTITIEATAEGIQFLKQIESNIGKYAIEAARMEEAIVSNPGLEAKIKTGFIANSDGKVLQVNRVIITSKPWYIKRNAYGTVIYKDFYAQVAFKKADGKYYIQKVRCVSQNVNGIFQQMKVFGKGNSYEIRYNNINK